MEEEEKNKLNLNEYKTIKLMLNATNEDFIMATENIKNLNLEFGYLMLFAKDLVGKKRKEFITQSNLSVNPLYLKMQYIPVDDRFHWKTMFKFIKDSNPSNNCKNIVAYEFAEKLINQSYFETFLPIKEIKEIILKLKWND